MIKDNSLLDLVICPRTNSELKIVYLENGSGLLSKEDGVLYPIINGVIIMKPVSQQVRNMCLDFFSSNENALYSLGTEYNHDLTCQVLDYCATPDQLDWHGQEMTYWEGLYEKQLRAYKDIPTNWDRTLPRGKLLSKLPAGLNHKIIFEIGCGSSFTLIDIYGHDIPLYIGLDLSYYACLLAKEQFPNALLIQGSAEKPPFKDVSIDVVIAYGVFHHLPGHEENILSIIPKLKPDGYIIGADPLLKPRLPRPWQHVRNKLKNCDEHAGGKAMGVCPDDSPHNEWIDWPNLLNIIKDYAHVAESIFEYGALRYLIIMIFFNKLGFRGKKFINFVIILDRLWLATIGKIHRSLGPAAVHYAVQKNKGNADN